MRPDRYDVSYVIAAYNAEAFLARAVESVLAQTGVAVEVIVVDDRSSDRTMAVAESFACANVAVIALPENSGPSGARNAALEYTTGRWIAVLDSDDALLPERTARIVDRGEDAGADLVIDNLTLSIDGKVRARPMFPTQKLQAGPRLGLADYIRSNRMFGSAVNFGYAKPMIRRAFVEKHRLCYDPAVRVGEDYLFMASALALGAVCAVEPEPGYLYSVRAGSISHILDAGHIAALKEADRRFEAAHRLDPEAAAALRAHQRSLDEAASFLALVDHLKSRSVTKALATALSDPAALRHLRLPLAARLRRLAAHLPVPRLV